MQFASLFAKIDAFTKQAGLLKTPETLLKNVTEFIIASYCAKLGNILEDLLKKLRANPVAEDKFWLQQYTLMYGYCKRLSANISLKELEFGKRFIVPASDLPYTKSKDNYALIGAKLVDNQEATEIDPQSSWAGLWTAFIDTSNPWHHIGNVFINAEPDKDIDHILNLRGLEERLAELKATTRHEVQHFVQSFINYLQGGLGGLPSKSISDPRFNPHGQPLGEEAGSAKSQARFNPLRFNPLDEGGKVYHPLRDIEFYTRLSDSITDFNAVKTYLPVALHRDFMLAWVDHITRYQFEARVLPVVKEKVYRELNIPAGTTYHSDAEAVMKGRMNTIAYRVFKKVPNEFFQWLKGYQPGKYRKAVSEFSKAVGL